MSTQKTIINLLFSETEISELYRIKNQITINYLNDLDVDTFSNPCESELVIFIENIFIEKGIKFDTNDIQNILNLVNHNILI